ncbi:MAG: hypothetical protein RL220_1520 [Bacteroidota bacterium]|jgi:CRP-like cAMP-binding protein
MIKTTPNTTDFSKLRRNLEARVKLNDKEFEAMTSRMSVIHLKKREHLVVAGEVCRHSAYVNKGCLRTYHTDAKGVDHVLALSFEDWWVGDITSFLTGQPAYYSIEALEDCELLGIDFESQEEIFKEFPVYERHFRLLVQNAFIASQHRVIAEMTRTAEQRYLALLDKFPGIELRVAQQHIASYLGITPEALSRIRKGLVIRQKSEK